MLSFRRKRKNAFEVGDRVLAIWSEDGFWYAGKIINKMDERYYVKFYKGDKEWRSLAQVNSLSNLEKVKAIHYRQKNTPRFSLLGKFKKLKGEKLTVLAANAKEEVIDMRDFYVEEKI